MPLHGIGPPDLPRRAPLADHCQLTPKKVLGSNPSLDAFFKSVEKLRFFTQFGNCDSYELFTNNCDNISMV